MILAGPAFLGRLPSLVLASPLARPSVARFASVKFSLCLIYISGATMPAPCLPPGRDFKMLLESSLDTRYVFRIGV